MHTAWNDLPGSVRRAVVARTGPVRSVTPAGAGATCRLAATLQTGSGVVFVKGILVGDRLAWTLRNEIRVNPHLPGIAPRLLWHVEQDGWLVAGFEHVAGRHADLRPGSADLSAVAAVLAGLAAAPRPGLPVRPFAARWSGLIDSWHVAGSTLAHTDMSRRNWLIGDGGARLVDWATPAVGPAWLDTAFTVVRLVRYGHSPADAEGWAGQIPAFSAASGESLTRFAGALADMWQRQQDRAPAAHRGLLVDAARAWCRYRSGRSAVLMSG
ncbi:hypothetical protein [Micromonospora sonchi]|uniref:hypothetical protein n=1 Tax=Micromonospora sonchi TaxID=1763543 RepID=UPI001E5CF71D|nr:hypothetical protein [Micromonospora sonchi]